MSTSPPEDFGPPAGEPVVELAPAQVVRLCGTEDVWVLRRGRANVFTTLLDAGRASSARRFLFTIEAPGIVLGLPDAEAQLRIEAVIDPGSEVDVVSRATLFAREMGAYRDLAIAGTDLWFESWNAGCARILTSRPARDLANGDDILLPEGRILDGLPSLIWRRVGQGEGAFFDLVPVGGAGLDLFPLSQGAWVRSFDALRLVPITTHQMFNRGFLLDALSSAERALMEVSRVALSLEQVDEALRRGRRSAQLSEDTRRVVGDLGRMVGAENPHRVDQTANRALFSAIYVLADRFGIRAKMPSSVRQAEAELEPSLIEILRASGIQSRPVRLASGWQARTVDDLLAFRGADQHPVALLRDRFGRFRLHDAEAGEIIPLTPAEVDQLGEDAHVLYQPLPDKPIKLRDLIFFGLQRSTPDLATLAGAALLAALLGSAPSMGSHLIFDSLIPQHLTGLLFQTGLALMLFALISAVFVYSGAVSMARIRARASARLKAALWDRVLRQPMEFLNRYTAPDLTTAENAVGAFHSTAQQSANTLGMLIVNIATMIWLVPAVAPLAIGLLLLLAAVTAFAGWAQKKAFTGGEQAEGSTTTFVHALTNGVRKLRLAGAEERAFVKWADRFTRSRLKLINVRKVTNRFGAFLSGYTLLATAALFVVIGQLNTSALGVGSFFGFISAFGIALGSLGSLGRAMLQLAFQIASVPYIKPLLDFPPPLQAKKSNPGKLSGGVEVSNVSFGYGADGLVLAGVSFTADPGEFIAIVGPTGSGKSTVLKLLLGLETPLAGAVMYNQHDLASLDLDAVRQQIGVVMQRPQLMPTSIFENLRGVADIDMDEAWEAARLAGIAADIEAMPMGMHTIVTEGSQTISGGQRQRLALARALARKPTILLLDEATSALDNGAQADVMANLNNLGCTRIVIAHRLSTVINSDRIIVLEAGRVAESGTYASLMASGGLFARLASGQLTN